MFKQISLNNSQEIQYYNLEVHELPELKGQHY